MKTILVSGASGIVGYGALRSLRAGADSGYKLIGTTIYEDSVAPAFCDIFELAPMTDSGNYIDWLCRIVQKHQTDMIIPGIEADVLLWNKERKRIEEAGAKPLLNEPDLIELCSDKWKFYEKLCETDSKLLIESRLAGSFEELKEHFGLPFLLKPRRGFASQGIVTVDSEDTFNRHQPKLGPLVMAQPIVGNNDQEFTVSAFFDQSSALLCHMGLKRKLSREGFTEKAEVASPRGIEDALTSLAASLKPVGPTNFQFRMHHEQLKLLEINPRISSATSIRTAFGYNESVMSVEYFLDHKIPVQTEILRGYAVRYVEDRVFYAIDSVRNTH
ncbi:MAG: ATP-grasp domain-containing protein [Nitrososphaerales archaeon]|jgi:carbamoyl-phosphate synthase large subunit